MFAPSLFFGAVSLSITNCNVYQKSDLSVIFVNPHTVGEEIYILWH